MNTIKLNISCIEIYTKREIMRKTKEWDTKQQRLHLESCKSLTIYKMYKNKITEEEFYD